MHMRQLWRHVRSSKTKTYFKKNVQIKHQFQRDRNVFFYIAPVFSYHNPTRSIVHDKQIYTSITFKLHHCIHEGLIVSSTSGALSTLSTFIKVAGCMRVTRCPFSFRYDESPCLQPVTDTRQQLCNDNLKHYFYVLTDQTFVFVNTRIIHQRYMYALRNVMACYYTSNI